MLTTILVASKNEHKLSELIAVLTQYGIKVKSLLDFPDAPEVEETGKTFIDNARLKALAYSSYTNLPALADDSGLCVEALDFAPGVYSARYAGEPTDFSKNNEKLLKELEGKTNRGAEFVCSLCLAQKGEVLIETQGRVAGTILEALKGEGGFGYDPLFYYQPLKKSFAELSADDKNKISHRAKALKNFRQKLTALKIETEDVSS